MEQNKDTLTPKNNEADKPKPEDIGKEASTLTDKINPPDSPLTKNRPDQSVNVGNVDTKKF